MQTTPRIFAFWFGPRMSVFRRRALWYLRRRAGVPIQLIHEGNLPDWIAPEQPLHPAFKNLSATHKSDYLRTYFMLVHGGGYSDIKPINLDWTRYFSELDASGKEFFGYPEFGPNGVSGPIDDPLAWKKLVGACYYIFRRNGSFAGEWMERIHSVLDERIDLLERHPGDYHPRAVTGGVFQPRNAREASITSRYPLEWTQLNGDIFHPLQLERLELFSQALPAVRWRRYR